MPKLPTDQDRLLAAEDLLADHAARAAEGQRADFESLVRAHPSLEHELRTLHGAAAEVSAELDAGKAAFAAEQARIDAILAQIGGESRASTKRRYVLEGEVGKGGMGIVYRVRDTKLDRVLAMKVVLGHSNFSGSAKSPPIAARQLARFVNEAKITSSLDHPGIVPVHEVGVDEEGRAYFTMKLVKGTTLADVFVRRTAGDTKRSMPRALGMIARVCEAIAFAHERGVIHRDLKPQNVMVGDFGEVYVMDWGLARRLGDAEDTREANAEVDARLEEQLSLTRDGAIVGTPAYMSPEQARGEIMRIDARSDVYAVGAMLYELVAGHPPYITPGKRSTAAEILIRVKTSPPARLESRTAPPDLIAIAERAMARDRDNRYASLRELAKDLQRFVSGQTVRAFETGTWAETRKWVLRNRALSSTIAMALIVTLAGGIAFGLKALEASRRAHDVLRANARITWQNDQLSAAIKWASVNERMATQREQDAVASERRATRVTEFINDILRTANPVEGGAQGYLVVDAMRAALRSLEGRALDDDPDAEAAIREVIAGVLVSNGLAEEALTVARRALDLRRVLCPGDDSRVADSLHSVAYCLRAAGCDHDALQLFEAALAMRRRLCSRRTVAHDFTDIAMSLDGVAACLESTGRVGEALTRYQEALSLRAEMSRGKDDENIARSLNNIALCLDSSGRHEDALKFHFSALEMRRRIYEGDHPALAISLGNLSMSYLELQCAADAIPFAEESLRMNERLFGKEHPAIAKSLNNLGMALSAVGRRDAAIAILKDALAMRQRVFAGVHPDIAQGLNNLGMAEFQSGAKGEAQWYFERAFEAYERLDLSASPDAVKSLINVGFCLFESNAYGEALVVFDLALRLRRSAWTGASPEQVWCANNIAYCFLRMNCNAEALEYFELAYQGYCDLGQKAGLGAAVALRNIASCVSDAGSRSDAASCALDALVIAQSVAGVSESQLGEFRQVLARVQ